METMNDRRWWLLGVFLGVVGCVADVHGPPELETASNDPHAEFVDEPEMILDPDEEGCAVVEVSAEESELQASVAVAKSGGTPHVVFLNRHGGTYRSGSNNSATNRSSIVSGTRRVPAYERSDEQWDALVACVRDQFSRFNVHVTDIEPSAGNYVEAVIGGRPSAIGRSGIAGIAPVDYYNCAPIEKAVAYIFSANIRSDRRVCEVTAHEVGHTMSLEHAYKCEDPMTYLSGCGAKTFQDSSERCGTGSPKRCKCRGGRQNTVQALYDLVGTASGEPPPDASDDVAPPEVTILEPSDRLTLQENSEMTVVARASDDVYLSRVELQWDFNNKSYGCPFSDNNVSCVRGEDDTFTWTIRVSTGQRAFRVRALDFTGKESVTETRTVILTPDGDSPPELDDGEAPVIVDVSPGDGAQWLPKSVNEVSATITDDLEVADVALQWDFNGKRYACPGEDRFVTCVVEGDTYRWRIEVGSEDARPFTITATDRAGNTSTTERRVIDVAQVVDREAPSLDVLSPDSESSWSASSVVTVSARATDNVEISSVELLWDYNGVEYECPRSGRYVDCSVEGDVYTWVVTIGGGATRSFTLRASDSAGNVTTTESINMPLGQ